MVGRLVRITHPNIWYKDLSIGIEFNVEEVLPKTYRTIWEGETVDFLKEDCILFE